MVPFPRAGLLQMEEPERVALFERVEQAQAALNERAGATVVELQAEAQPQAELALLGAAPTTPVARVRVARRVAAPRLVLLPEAELDWLRGPASSALALRQGRARPTSGTWEWTSSVTARTIG